MKFKPSILEEKIQATFSPDAYATQVNKGLEQIVEGGKISMKLAAQQNAFFFNAFTKALSGSLLPNPFGFALDTHALEGCVAIQKNMLEVAMGQGAAVLEAIQEAGKNADKATAEFSNMVQQSLHAAQKEITQLAVTPVNSPEAKA